MKMSRESDGSMFSSGVPADVGNIKRESYTALESRCVESPCQIDICRAETDLGRRIDEYPPWKV